MSSPRCNISLNPDVNEVVSCVQNGTLKGIPADSASPTDVYIFKFLPNTYFGNDPVENGFMKVFVSNVSSIANPSFVHYDEEIKALEYEIGVYERTKKLVDNNVIGHFVKYFTSLMRPTKFDNLRNFIMDKAGIIYNTAEKNLERNTIFMIYPQRYGRPAIQDSTPILTTPSYLLSKNLVRYKFILTEAVIPYSLPAGLLVTAIQNFTNSMPINSSIKLVDINSLMEQIKCTTLPIECTSLRNTLLEIYFQLAVTNYAMYLNNFVHNDLHDGNVWIKRINPKNIKYTLQKVTGTPSYTLTNCNNFSLVYDYDRAFKKPIDNPLLSNSPNIPDYNQSNDMIQQRDFVKILCYFMNSLLPSKIPIAGSIRYKLLKDNTKIETYNDLLDCICKKNISGTFVNQPTVAGITWQPDTTKWPNDVDRYKDFWDRIFNNIEVFDIGGVEQTMDNYECFLNKSGGKKGINPSMFLGKLKPELFEETLYTMPEIIENLAKLINKYSPGKILVNSSTKGDYNYVVRSLAERTEIPKRGFFGLFNS